MKREPASRWCWGVMGEAGVQSDNTCNTTVLLRRLPRYYIDERAQHYAARSGSTHSLVTRGCHWQCCLLAPRG